MISTSKKIKIKNIFIVFGIILGTSFGIISSTLNTNNNGDQSYLIGYGLGQGLAIGIIVTLIGTIISMLIIRKSNSHSKIIIGFTIGGIFIITSFILYFFGSRLV